jgi:hypothetical protein
MAVALIESLRVPDVPYVEVLRDTQQPELFYLLPDRPQIALDAVTKLPLFSFTLFSRNIEIAYASAEPGEVVENQLGQLNLTVDLSVRPEDEARIRAYLAGLLERERQQDSFYNRIFRVPTTETEPVIAQVNTWQQGNVRLEMLEELGATFKRSSSKDAHPLLRGTNAASLWATFGTEGAQLLWKVLTGDDPRQPDGGGVPLQANIVYELDGFARSPALQVEVTAKSEPVYQELVRRTELWRHDGHLYWDHVDVTTVVRELHQKDVIKINWDDYGVPQSDPQFAEIKQKLQTTVLDLITNKIISAFFRQYAVDGAKTQDTTATVAHHGSFLFGFGRRMWLHEYQQNTLPEISFTLNQQANFPFKAYPQTSLLTSLTREQRRQLVRVVDVGSPEVQVMTVPVYTNADFEGDKIANITATLSYRQFDTLVDDWIDKSETFVFRTGEETFLFRTRLARDAEGRLIDKYEARARVNYIGTSESPRPIEHKDVTDRAMTFSYDRLGYLAVTVKPGSIDWDLHKEVFVDLALVGDGADPDAQATVRLTKDTVDERWVTRLHGAAPTEYQHTARYQFQDGGEETGPPQRKPITFTELAIDDLLVGRLRKSFDVTLDQGTVENVTLRVVYQDPLEPPAGRPPLERAEARHVFTSTGSWEYVRPLRQGGTRALRYGYIIQYDDGMVENVPLTTLEPDEDPPPLRARRYPLTLTFDGDGLDWDAWRAVYLQVKYADERKGFEQFHDVRVSRDAPLKTVDIPAFSPDARTFDFHATFVPRGDRDPVDVPADGTSSHRGPLVLETLV